MAADVTRASPSTCAISVARLTLAAATPGTRFSTRSIRPAQAAQVMPVTPTVKWRPGPAGAEASNDVIVDIDGPSYHGKVKGKSPQAPGLTFLWWEGPYSALLVPRSPREPET